MKQTNNNNNKGEEMKRSAEMRLQEAHL
jgi:hypothetical protein